MPCCKYLLSVHPSSKDAVIESGAFEWAPSAFAQDVLFADGGCGIGIDENEVGVIAHTYLSATCESEALSGMLAHQFHNLAQW